MDDLGSQKEEVVKLRATIEQQAQELEKLKGVLGANEVLVERLAAMIRERDEAICSFNYAIARESERNHDLATAQARCREMERELIKWQQPFDAELLKATEQQASHADSLAAQRAYINALEHAIKQQAQEITKLKQHINNLESTDNF